MELEIPSSIPEIYAMLPYLEHALCTLPGTLRALVLKLIVSPPLLATELDEAVVQHDMWSRVAAAIADSELTALSITADGVPWNRRQIRRFRHVFRHSTGRAIAVWKTC